MVTDKVEQKVRHAVARQIQEMAKGLLVGTYSGTVQVGGHDHHYQVRVTDMQVDVCEMGITWEMEMKGTTQNEQ